ncbi:hypothetical protein K502DRAFT_355369 [Neoconidiobolus thromboides FSU 785]|nr:hypothetical protein K502DRAFT_355369 [Neoconidiobolus thromboides FSU 785]
MFEKYKNVSSGKSKSNKELKLKVNSAVNSILHIFKDTDQSKINVKYTSIPTSDSTPVAPTYYYEYRDLHFGKSISNTILSFKETKNNEYRLYDYNDSNKNKLLIINENKSASKVKTPEEKLKERMNVYYEYKDKLNSSESSNSNQAKNQAKITNIDNNNRPFIVCSNSLKNKDTKYRDNNNITNDSSIRLMHIRDYYDQGYHNKYDSQNHLISCRDNTHSHEEPPSYDDIVSNNYNHNGLSRYSHIKANNDSDNYEG